MKDLFILQSLVRMHLMKIFSELDNLERVYYLIIDDVIRDIEECADPDNWNNSDVSIAIQRVMMDKFNWN